MKSRGEYGKLLLKPNTAIQSAAGDNENLTVDTGRHGEHVDSLFVGISQTEQFVSSNLPASYNPTKKRKITSMVSDLCMEISSKLGKFVQDIGKLDDDEPEASKQEPAKVKRRRDQGPDKGNKKRNQRNEEDQINYQQLCSVAWSCGSVGSCRGLSAVRREHRCCITFDTRRILMDINRQLV